MATTRFLAEDGLIYLVGKIADLIDDEILAKIVSDIDNASTNQEIAGAKAVYDFVTGTIGSMERVRLSIVTALPATGETNIIYLIRQGTTSTYNMYAWISGTWADLGTTDIDLSNYWAKADLVALTNTEIDEIFDNL